MLATDGHLINSAIHWWCLENPVPDHARGLLSFLFTISDSLYTEAASLPPRRSIPRTPMRLKIGKSSEDVILRLLGPQEWARMRSAIGLAGDAFGIAKNLQKCVRGTSLEGPIDALLHELDALRDVRNFFAHLDERIESISKHGLSGGPLSLPFGVEIGESVGTFVLVVDGPDLFFSDNGVLRSVDVSRDGYVPALEALRPIYSTLASHKADAASYPPAAGLYDKLR